MPKQILLKNRPTGMPTHENFEIRETEIRQPGQGELLIRTVYISVDPYLRGRMNDTKSYIPPFQLNEVISSGVIGQVEESQSDLFKKGDLVLGSLGWEEYSIAKETTVRKIDSTIAPASSYLSVLGMTGLTAYFGLIDIGKPKTGETVVVSGAAGAVGSIVGQIAKLKGCRVVGIAGSTDKVKYLVEELGFDAAINYKTQDVGETLKEVCPNGIDVYFENVGGKVTDAVYPLLNNFARIPVCGAISSYNNETEDIGPRVQSYLIKTSSLMQGFTVGNYSSRFGEGIQVLAGWLKDGKLKYEETITEGFDNTIEAFLSLFKGANLGKAIVTVSEIQ
ncbi:NADP-dependent oxidoreductase [Paenibacillus sp. BSR1-1]|uniref:NADP-dependent oxidoreductase n=1 Tax=Paenibacillus sp. BSR1-1 TaxID=3020845 RepID=UPI0025B27391|nr:NADP-dependent oxidoreductase [Paenibacillus sp. BSR1-1]MDN3019491.1 NADP-dependent oxidoreductase [Paenibacillus sp. BSR1-1]